MDGLFSPVATWMSRRDGLAVGASFMACPEGDPKGRVLLVTFLARARKVTRPWPRSFVTECFRRDGRNNPLTVQGRWHYFARLKVSTLYKAQLIRASNYRSLHKESHQRNAPR